jgi:outer membrane protein insertion porin family
LWEDNIAYFNNITVKGNTRTNDHVIHRNIRSNPEKNIKSAIINSIRIGAARLFNAEKINPRIFKSFPNKKKR